MVILYIYQTCWHMKLVFYERQQCRGFGNLTNLSLSRLQMMKDKEESKRGRIRFGAEVTRSG
jgi:hypothetical protein